MEQLEQNEQHRVNMQSVDYEKDEKWSDAHENLAQQWLDQSKSASKQHNKLGKKAKYMKHMLALPTICISIMFSPIAASSIGKADGMEWVIMSAFIISGCLNATSTLFDFAGKHEKHMNFSANYAAIETDILHEMAKGRNFRISADEFLMKIRMKMDSLTATAPDL